MHEWYKITNEHEMQSSNLNLNFNEFIVKLLNACSAELYHKGCSLIIVTVILISQVFLGHIIYS